MNLEEMKEEGRWRRFLKRERRKYIHWYSLDVAIADAETAIEKTQSVKKMIRVIANKKYADRRGER